VSTDPVRTAGADEGMAIGTPGSRRGAGSLVICGGARLHAGTVRYDGSAIWRRLQTGDGVIVPEGCL
jgi:hypothetical protein